LSLQSGALLAKLRAVDKRLEMLEKMMAAGASDSFGWYALAMEYRRLGRVQEAMNTFSTLRERDPEYLPMYLMAGQLCVELSEPKSASEWLTQGIALAKQKGDAKALGELEALAADLS
jgi:tetratricopeptide (TPR) repeat protein